MKKILLLASLLIGCIMITGCEQNNPKNKLVGTCWKWHFSMWDAIVGGRNYDVLQFKTNTTYDNYGYDEVSGEYSSVYENLPYKYENDTIYITRYDGDVWKLWFKNSKELTNGNVSWTKFGGYN